MAICEGLSSCIAHRLRCVLRITNRLHLIVLKSGLGCRVTNDSRISGSASTSLPPFMPTRSAWNILRGKGCAENAHPLSSPQ